jgi:hypothetical protein
MKGSPVYFGGPVQTDRGFVLHRPLGGWSSTLKVTDEIGLTTSKDILQAVGLGEGPDDIIMTLGYAGWSAGQLESEIAQNAWLTVAADPQVMFAADRMLDIGPGPGERGGRIVYWGEPEGLRRADTLTGDYLSGRKSIPATQLAPITASTPKRTRSGSRGAKCASRAPPGASTQYSGRWKATTDQGVRTRSTAAM